MSKLTDILHELAQVTGRHQLHADINALEAEESETVQDDKPEDETLTEGGK